MFQILLTNIKFESNCGFFLSTVVALFILHTTYTTHSTVVLNLFIFAHLILIFLTTAWQQRQSTCHSSGHALNYAERKGLI